MKYENRSYLFGYGIFIAYFKENIEYMVGIYKITNLVNGKVYIGQSGNLDYRWIHHRSDLRGNIHHNVHLQAAWRKYGEESFMFEIIEQCNIDDLNNREQYWINYYDSHDPEKGYNLDLGGTGTRGYKHTKEEIERMRKIQSPLVVLEFDESFNLVQRWSGGSSHIRKEKHYTKECIDLRCTHRIREMSLYKGSYWVYEKEYISPDFNWEKYLNNEKIVELTKNSKPKIKKRICQYTKSGDFVQVWESYSDLNNAGFNSHSIIPIVNQSRGKKTHKGFIWAFEDYDFSDGYFDKVLYKTAPQNPIEPKGHFKKAIIQIDPDTMLPIKEYASLTEAAFVMGLKNNGSMSIAANSNLTKKSMGYYWQYKQ